MTTIMMPNKDLVDKKAIASLLQLFQTCEGKDSHYLKEKGHVQVMDVYFVLMNSLKCADNSLLIDTVVAAGQFLNNVSWMECLTEEQCGDVILELCNIIETTNEKAICSRAIWCFYSQNLSTKILSKHMKTILLAFSKTTENERFVSSSVEFEATRATKAFLSKNPQDVLVLSEIWWRDCLGRTVHPAARVRDMALSIITEYRHMLGQNNHVMQIIPDEVKSTIVPGMLRLFSENGELYVLKLWQAIVNLCGKIIHQGSSLINSLLVVVDKAFKYSSDDMRVASFACWRELISNFAVCPDVIGNVKRLRLIMQPLCGKNAKSESTLGAKVDTWWHLLSCLGLNQNSFEMVLEPLIRFCFGLGEASGLKGSIKSRSGIDSTTSHAATNAVFVANKSLLVGFGIEILGRFFEVCSAPSAMKLPQTLTLGPLKNNTLSKQSVLINHSAVLLHAVEIATCTQLTDKESWPLLSYIWLNVTNHLKSHLDTPDNKPNMHDAISNFFQTVEVVVRWDAVDSRTVFAILEYAASLPAAVLMSSSYNLGQNNKQNSTPGFQLLGLLLSKNVVEKFGYNNKFMALFNRLTTFSSLSAASVLNSFHLTMQMFSTAVPDFQKDDLICKLWLSLITRLLEFVEESQEVNQGDSLEHDFSCMHASLVFPFQHFIWKLAVKRSVLKKWEAVYQVFARCAAVVSGVEVNACCVELASKLKAVIPESLQIDEIEDMIYVMDVLLSSVNWSVVKKSAVNSRENKWLRKKSAEIFELSPIAQLIGGIINSFIKAASNLLPASKSHCVNIASTLLGYFDMFFERLKNDSVIQAVSFLSEPFVEIMRLSCNSNSIFADHNVLNKIEAVWEKLTKNLLLNYKGAYDTSMLNALSPLLEATFSHKKRSIQINTRLFWQGTFASSYDQHLIPDSLREVIEKVKPSIGADNSSLDDKAIMSSSESKIGTAQKSSVLVESGVASPKVSGSFLNKFTKSPASAKKLVSSPALKSTPKSKGIEEMNAKDFVVIRSPGKGKRRVLTEHQKEVASRRSLIPAMYVDLSQDSCVIPTETQEVEDSQTVTEINKDSIEEIPVPCSLSLNEENCAAQRINTCVVEGSDEASIELLDSHSCMVNDKPALETASDTNESPNSPSVQHSPGLRHDKQDSLAIHAKTLKSGNSFGIDESSKDEQADSSQNLNVKKSEGSKTNASLHNYSRRSTLRNSKEKVYTYGRRHQMKKKASKIEDQLSCDFVAETCEFRGVPEVAESQNSKLGEESTKNHTIGDTDSCDDKVQSKDADNGNGSEHSEDLLQEMGIRSLSSVSVICEVMTAKQISCCVGSSGSSLSKTSQESDAQKQDSVIVIGSSSSLDTSQSLDTSSAEFCSPRRKRQALITDNAKRKRRSLKACMGSSAAGSPPTKVRKSDKLTEEEVLVNIRARKRKFHNDANVDLSPPLTRTRKRRKQSDSESLRPVDAQSPPDMPSCLRTGAQTPSDNLVALTMENEVSTIDTHENFDIPDQLPSVIPAAGSNSEPENTLKNQHAANRQDLSDDNAKPIPTNQMPTECCEKEPEDNPRTVDMQIESSSESPAIVSETLPVVLSKLDLSTKATMDSNEHSGIPAACSNPEPENMLNNQHAAVQQVLPDGAAKTSVDDLPVNDITESSAKATEDNRQTSDISETLPVASTSKLRRSPRKDNQAVVLERGFLSSSQDRQHVAEKLDSVDKLPYREDGVNENEISQNPSPSSKNAASIFRHAFGTLASSLPTADLTVASPSVSPSGIMKKAGSNPKTLTPTTPNRRKVSFADPPVQGESPHTPTSSRRSLSRIVNRRLHMTKNYSQDSSSGQYSIDMSQDSYHSPMITELNCKDCICPELVDSKEPIDILIPHLTSSLHGRGLSKLLSSRNITTIGDLSAMTEADVHTLPIKAPKLSVVRRALSKISEQAKSAGNGASPLRLQNNTKTVSAIEDALETSLSVETSPIISVTDTPEKDPAAELRVPQDCSPLKKLEDEMADDSLCEINVVDVIPSSDQLLSTSDKCETSTGSELVNVAAANATGSELINVAAINATGSELVNDDVAATTSESTNDNPFQDIYQFLNTRFDQITPSHLSKMTGNQIRELIANMGAFSTRVSEAWLDSKCNAHSNQKLD